MFPTRFASLTYLPFRLIESVLSVARPTAVVMPLVILIFSLVKLLQQNYQFSLD